MVITTLHSLCPDTNSSLQLTYNGFHYDSVVPCCSDGQGVASSSAVPVLTTNSTIPVSATDSASPTSVTTTVSAAPVPTASESPPSDTASFLAGSSPTHIIVLVPTEAVDDPMPDAECEEPLNAAFEVCAIVEVLKRKGSTNSGVAKVTKV